jgi:signal transduction histidine kinase
MVRWPREHGVWLLVGALAILLGILAVLQYRWTGEIGRAEADRQHARLERASQRFARDLGRELGQVVGAFRPEMPGPGASDPRESLLRRLREWRATEHGALVSRVTLVTASSSGETHAELANAEGSEFARVPFPPRLEPFGRQLREGLEARNFRRGGFRPDAFLAGPPAFVMPVVEPGRGTPGGPGSFRLAGIAVVELDEDYLADVLLPELAEIHFGPLDEGDYAVAVLRRPGDSVLYSSDGDLSPEELARPDVRLDLSPGTAWLGATRDRFAHGRRFGSPRGVDDRGPRPWPRDPPPPPQTGEAVAEGDRRADGGPPGGGRGGFEGGPPGGVGSPWVLVVRHRGGSLAQAVATVRRRNLAVGFGVLALLGTAAVLLAVGGQRARHLARQQLEFVAGVTHELHTPLAAIRSAGQNLADGVVSEPGQTRRYGELIQKEGGRLSALVTQVLDFAGIESGSRTYATEPVSVAHLVDEVVGDLGLVLEQTGMTIEADIPGDLPDLRGDADALRRALENVVTNATKFARQGGWIGIRALASPDRRTVTLEVDDRGPGIPRAERERVLEPFYRGHGAREIQAPGSGLGLGLVRHVVEAHGGRVRVSGRPGGGTTVALELPVGTKTSGQSG